MLVEDEANGKLYIQYRNVLNNAMIHFTRNMRMGNTSGTTVQQLDQYMKNVIANADKIGEKLYIPSPRILEIIQGHQQRVASAFESYRSAVGFQQNLNNMNDQLFMQELIRNSIY